MKKAVINVILMAMMIFTSCGKIVMTVESPESAEIEAELSGMLDEIFIDELDTTISYKNETYIVKAKRELEEWEKKGLGRLMNKIIASDGIQELPVHMQLVITENDMDILNAIEMKKNQVFDFYITSSSVITTTNTTNSDQEVYYIGVEVICDKEFPSLQYAMEINDEAAELLQIYQNLMQSLGPLMADYKLIIKDGEKEVLLDESFEYLKRGIYFTEDIIYSAMSNPWGGPDQEDIMEGLREFITGTGFSSKIISCLLYPYLSRDAVNFKLE